MSRFSPLLSPAAYTLSSVRDRELGLFTCLSCLQGQQGRSWPARLRRRAGYQRLTGQYPGMNFPRDPCLFVLNRGDGHITQIRPLRTIPQYLERSPCCVIILKRFISPQRRRCTVTPSLLISTFIALYPINPHLLPFTFVIPHPPPLTLTDPNACHPNSCHCLRLSSFTSIAPTSVIHTLMSSTSGPHWSSCHHGFAYSGYSV